jgi:hypothetical protein
MDREEQMYYNKFKHIKFKRPFFTYFPCCTIYFERIDEVRYIKKSIFDNKNNTLQ